MEVNYESRLNVDEQQDDKTFKVKSDIDDSGNHSCQNPHVNKQACERDM